MYNDDDDGGSHAGSGEGFSESKRANHNALERKRRVFQKERLLELKESVPIIRNEKPSTVEILERSTDYIEQLKDRHVKQQLEIDVLRKENTVLTEELLLLPNNADNEQLKEQLAFLQRMEQEAAVQPIVIRPNPNRTLHHAGSSTAAAAAVTNGYATSRKRAHTISAGDFETSKRMHDASLLTEFCDTVRKSITVVASSSSMSAVMVVASEEMKTEQDIVEADSLRATVQQVVSEGFKDEYSEGDKDEEEREAEADEAEADEAAAEKSASTPEPAPSTRAARARAKIEASPIKAKASKPEDGDERLCVCGKPWGGRFMLMCDACEQWFHGSCVNVMARRVPKSWHCKTCIGSSAK